MAPFLQWSVVFRVQCLCVRVRLVTTRRHRSSSGPSSLNFVEHVFDGIATQRSNVGRLPRPGSRLDVGVHETPALEMVHHRSPGVLVLLQGQHSLGDISDLRLPTRRGFERQQHDAVQVASDVAEYLRVGGDVASRRTAFEGVDDGVVDRARENKRECVRLRVDVTHLEWEGDDQTQKRTQSNQITRMRHICNKKQAQRIQRAPPRNPPETDMTLNEPLRVKRQRRLPTCSWVGSAGTPAPVPHLEVVVDVADALRREVLGDDGEEAAAAQSAARLRQDRLAHVHLPDTRSWVSAHRETRGQVREGA